MFDVSEVLGGVDAEVGSFADVAAQQAVAVLVCGSLPGLVGVREVDVDPAQLGELGVAGHLNASVVVNVKRSRAGTRSRISVIAASIMSAPWSS